MFRSLTVCLLLVMIGTNVAAETDSNLSALSGSIEELKRSGILKEWEMQLEKLLFEANDVHSDPAPTKDTRVTKLIRKFVETYIKDHDYKTRPDIILDMLDRTTVGVEDNEATYLVAVGGIIDICEELPERQATSVASFAEYTTALELRTILQEEKAAISPKMSNPAHLTAVVMTHVTNFIKDAKLNPIKGVHTLLEFAETEELITEAVAQTLRKYAKQFETNEDFIGILDAILEFADQFLASESGQRMMEVMPKLMEAEDMSDAMEMFRKEAEWNWGSFFMKIRNSDYKDQFIRQIASATVKSIFFVKDQALSDMNVLMANAFFLSQGLPPFNLKKPFQSGGQVINKALKIYTTWKFDVAPYAAFAENAYKDMQRRFASTLKGLDETAWINVLSNYLSEEIVTPMETHWTAFEFLRAGGDERIAACGPYTMCKMNAQAHSSGSDTKKAMTNGVSIGLAWALSWTTETTEDDDGSKAGSAYWQMYDAIWKGYAGEECSIAFKVSGHECDIPSGVEVSTGKMNLNYEHIEL